MKNVAGHARKVSLLLAPLLLLTACADGEEPPEDAGVPVVEPEPAPVYLNITFDYRFDDAGFFRPERRAVLEEAAATWGRIIVDDLPSIPPGTPLLTRDPSEPSAPSLDVLAEGEIDDIVIFVATADLGSIGGTTARSFPTAQLQVGDQSLQEELTARYDGDAFQPWSGWIAFDRNELWYADDDVDSVGDLPAQGTDLYSTALHEIGHILGIGTSSAFARHVDDEGAFAGPAAIAVYGGPVPLSGNETHLDDSVLHDDEPVLMNVTDPPGERTLPTEVDLAILEDIGWTLFDLEATDGGP